MPVGNKLGRCISSAAALLLITLAGVAPGRELPASKAEALYRYQERRSRAASATPFVEYTTHNRGNIQLAIANNGTFGTYGLDISDPFTAERIPSCIYPKNSNLVHLWVGAFWIGAVVGEDTLVSSGNDDFYASAEFWADPLTADLGEQIKGFSYRSIDPQSRFHSPTALSEQDILCEYTDTFTAPSVVNPDQLDNRPHRPLNIKVKQRSMAWSYSYADDFILFDYQIENIGNNVLRDVYMGIWVDGDVWHTSRNNTSGWNDDLAGFYRFHPAPEGCGFIDTVNIAWHADNDGDPATGNWDFRSTRSVMGTRVVRTPADTLEYSFNWWIINYSDASRDFGPRQVGTSLDPFRDMDGRLGTPVGDRNKYYLLRHREFDYDLLFTGVDHSRDGWMAPPINADEIAAGYDSRYLLSFGPFTLGPGLQLPISFAWVGGEFFHQEPDDFSTYFDSEQPEQFYERLDFSRLAANSRWASWVYDNPGVDTDDDGDSGAVRICVLDSLLIDIDTIITEIDTVIDSTYKVVVADTSFYEGDGVPDFRGAGPPPAPFMRIIPRLGQLIVRWNGYVSETTKDVFLQMVDFEGYRIYLALDDRPASFTLLTSWDIEDYRRYRWKSAGGQSGWVLENTPFTLDSLITLYGDSTFAPLQYTRTSPLVFDGERFYFEPQDFNSFDLDVPNGIRRAFPDYPKPPRDSSFWEPDEITYEHGIPLPKYYEYEYVIDNIQPTVPYYVAVTAFDFGSPAAGLDALETAPTNNMIIEFPMISADSVEAHQLDTYVYPNPYIISAHYADAGYENRGFNLPPERARRIHFANLPNVCTISIYSLDGDLIREWEHNYPNGGPGAMHDYWDLITRNTQSVVSGLYYYVVQSQDRTQIGKLVIVK